MDVFDADILLLWKCLQKNNVKYIMIGGFAVNLHGYSRSTNDIDIWVQDNLENRKGLRQALKEQGSGDYEPIETMDFIPGWTDFQLNMGFKLDIMTAVKGLEKIGFEECYKYSIVTEIEGVTVNFLHYNHLIECKKAAGRPKDLLDIAELEKIHKG
jgi:hypothetical protein